MLQKYLNLMTAQRLSLKKSLTCAKIELFNYFIDYENSKIPDL